MFKEKFNKLRSQLRRSGATAQPLVGTTHDVRLLQHVKKQKYPSVRQLWHAGNILSLRERLVLRAGALGLIVGLVWFGVVFGQTYRVQVAAVGGTYTEAIVGAPERVNPIYAPLNDVDMDIVRLVYSGLMRVDTKQRIVPDLAASYVVSDDKLVYTFTLREGITWHDGEPMTADDVLFTFETIQNEAVQSPLRVSFQGIKVEAPDDKTVRFTLSEPFAPFLSSLTVGILPAHKWSALAPEQILTTQLNLQPIGTGPFAFVDAKKNSAGFLDTYRLERFENYYRQPPFIEQFVFRFFTGYEHEDGAIQAIRQQQVDALQFVPTDLKPQVTRKHISLHTLQLPEYTALFFNQQRQPALEDSDVRDALAFAIDKERILRETLDGEGQIIYSPVLPGFPGYQPEIERTPYDVDQANTLLDEAGWERIDAATYREDKRQALLDEYFSQHLATSTEGVTTSTDQVPDDVRAQIEADLDAQLSAAQPFYRENDDGDLLEIRIVTSDTQEYRSAAERIAGFWQEIGVKADLRYVAPSSLSRDILRDRLYDVLLYGVLVGSDPDQYPFWHSSQVEYPGLNLSQYENSAVDDALEAAREAVDDEAITEAYVTLQEELLPDRPAIFLYMPTYTYATTERVQGQELSRIFSPADRFAGVIHWYLETRGQWRW